MMKEGQKERKKLVDTKRAFEFQNIRSFHAVQPGKSKRKDLIKKPTPDKKFKTAKQMEKDERRKREKEPFMGGGMAGRRFGYKDGSKKSSLGMQSVKYGLDNNPDVTKADPKAKFIAAANKKKKKVI